MQESHQHSSFEDKEECSLVWDLEQNVSSDFVYWSFLDLLQYLEIEESDDGNEVSNVKHSNNTLDRSLIPLSSSTPDTWV
jgi:hypothetical protein